MKHKYGEEFLYALVDELASIKAPIVFKGGLVLKDILHLYNEDLEMDRKTIDIDGNWVSEYDKEKIENVLKKALYNVDPSLTLKLFREPTESMSMGFKIYDSYGETLTSIDLQIKDNPFYIVCNINDVERKYSSLEKIMADKLLVLSGERVFRRSKDVFDVYLITNNQKVDMNQIFDILEYEGKELGDFSSMLKGKDKLKHAYDKLERIKNKPDFDTVWDSVINYLKKEKLIDLDTSKDIENDVEM